jgi:hypothetical protein
MTTPYNNQWALGRARWRRRERAAVRGTLAQAPPPPRPEQHEQPQRPGGQEHASRERTGSLLGGAARKRPRWVDRDT